MKSIYTIISAYISAKNDSESLHYENQLLVSLMLPIFVFVAVLNLIYFSVFWEISTLNMVVNCMYWLVHAGILLALQRLKTNDRLKSYILLLLFVGTMSFMVLRYYEMVGPTVWTITLVYILFAMIRTELVMAGVLVLNIIVLQLIIWSKATPYIIDVPYYSAQFIVFIMFFVVMTIVQKLNSDKVKIIHTYLDEYELISEISSSFISISANNLEEKIHFMLERSATYLAADFANIFLLSDDRQKLVYSYDWFSRAPEVPVTTLSYNVRSRPEWVSLLENRTVRIIADVNEMEQASPGKKELQAMKIRSLISMPVVIKDRSYGILFYGTHSNARLWSDAQKRLLVVLTNLLGDAFLKVESEKEINYMAYYDTLTGLPNRHYFNSRLDDAIQTAADNKCRMAVMFIDLDGFKSVNDTIGHEGGDVLLQNVSRRLTEHIGSHGIVGRLGGDEFIVLIPDLNTVKDIRQFVDSMLHVFTRPVIIENQEFYLTGSAGVALYPADGTNARMLKRNADMAMYVAKELGKNQAFFCTPELKDDIEKRARLTNLLHKALAREELMVYYQPLINIQTSEVVGVEALLRWNQGEMGMISPGVFIPLAEQTGLIYPIGHWILDAACRQNKAWQDAGLKPIRLAVNISIEQFRRTDVVDMVRNTLSETGLSPEYLELEITESVAIKETDYIRGKLEALRDLGVSISIDDFGTEYSSLTRIKRLPIDRVKMAMEFVHGISVSDKDEAIAKTIINLANNLGLRVIAEGVETQTQYSFLKNHACDEIQGYYFYKPMQAADLERLLRQQ